LLAGGSPITPGCKDAEKFFNSFKLTKAVAANPNPGGNQNSPPVQAPPNPVVNPPGRLPVAVQPLHQAPVKGTAPPAYLGKVPPPATTLPGLLAYWSFDQENGRQNEDASGKGNKGACVGVRWVKGVRGNALEFTGADSYFSLGDSAKLDFAANS